MTPAIRCGAADERLLIRLVDELHDSSTIGDELWQDLAAAFSVEQTFEAIALVGFYRPRILRHPLPHLTR